MNIHVNTGKEVKVNLVYKDFEGNIQIERVWAEKNGENYRIVNVPFFASNIAYGDIVSVEDDNGMLYFDELIEPSGHSTIQMIVYDKRNVEEIGKQLVDLGCDWEGSHLEGYISVDVPVMVSYSPVKKYLEDGFLRKKWDYKEACLSHKY
jgi:glutamate mutase epsilon subunit